MEPPATGELNGQWPMLDCQKVSIALLFGTKRRITS
jgi:hypothetical protein